MRLDAAMAHALAHHEPRVICSICVMVSPGEHDGDMRVVSEERHRKVSANEKSSETPRKFVRNQRKWVRPGTLHERCEHVRAHSRCWPTLHASVNFLT